jgi:hypothetical protein
MRYDTGCANAASVAALLAVQIHLGAVGVFESDVDLVRLERKRPGLGFAVSQNPAFDLKRAGVAFIQRPLAELIR